jgi:hypothetical protein
MRWPNATSKQAILTVDMRTVEHVRVELSQCIEESHKEDLRPVTV